MRNFDSGATRDDNDGKYVYTRFNSALVEKRFAQYMHEHRIQTDGSLRAGDNWKKGIPMEAYEDSLGRHYHDLWEMLEADEESIIDSSGKEVTRQDVLCALRFNINGMLHEELLFEGADDGSDHDWSDEDDDEEDEDEDTAEDHRDEYGKRCNCALDAIDSLSATRNNETTIDRYLREADEDKKKYFAGFGWKQ